MLFGIPLGVLASVGALGAYYVLEHPERRKADLVPARREVRLALERAGFFTNFGFVASAAVAIELAGLVRSGLDVLAEHDLGETT